LSRKIITVFGSSLPKETDPEYLDAYNLGCLLANNGFDVCTGGHMGIMDAVSKGAVEKGSKAIGITMGYMDSTPSIYLTTNIKMNSLSQRIEKLISIGDGYIVLKGGTGTLLELSTVWENLNKNLMKLKPISCHGQMWFNIVNEMEKRIEIEKRRTGLVKCFEDILDCGNYIIESLK